MTSNRPLGAWTERHLHRCKNCKEYYARLKALDAALKKTKNAEGIPVPDYLHTRIMGNLAERVQPHSKLRKFALSAALTFLIITTGFLLIRTFPSAGPAAQSEEMKNQQLDLLVDANRNAGKVVVQANSMVTQHLDRELNHLQSDIGRAIEFWEQLAGKNLVAME